MKARSLPEGKYSDGQGLYLIKRTKAHGKWVLRLVVYSKQREMGLGRWPDVSISEARQRAEDARKATRGGVDPIFERLRVKRAGVPLTLKEAIVGAYNAKKAELKDEGKAGRWMSPLEVHVIPKFGAYPVDKIDQHVLKELLAPIWETKPEAAKKALNRIGQTLRHAAALGLPVDLQATMKTRALLGKQRRTVEHIPSLPYVDAPAFFQSLGETKSALALKFLILTLGRTSEVRLAHSREIEDDIWTIPAERTKTGVSRRIPLVAEARKLVRDEYLFGAISDAAMLKLMKDRGLTARPHGFRATFRTWAEEQTDMPHEVKESVLGHVVDTGVVGAYQRSDRLEKRRELLMKWEAYLTHKAP